LFALQLFIFWCQEKAYFPTSVKASRLRGHVQCVGETFTCRAEVFKHGAEIRKGHLPAEKSIAFYF